MFFPQNQCRETLTQGSVGLLSGVFLCGYGDVAGPVERVRLAGDRARLC